MAAPTGHPAVIIEGRGKKIVFLDPSDPRIPSYDSYESNEQYERNNTGNYGPGFYPGLKVSYALVVNPADSAKAREQGMRMLKPYKSKDSTTNFFEQFKIPERKRSYTGAYFNDGLNKVIDNMNKRDILRAIYPFWAVEDYAAAPGKYLQDY